MGALLSRLPSKPEVLVWWDQTGAVWTPGCWFWCLKEERGLQLLPKTNQKRTKQLALSDWRCKVNWFHWFAVDKAAAPKAIEPAGPEQNLQLVQLVSHSAASADRRPSALDQSRYPRYATATSQINNRPFVSSVVWVGSQLQQPSTWQVLSFQRSQSHRCYRSGSESQFWGRMGMPQIPVSHLSGNQSLNQSRLQFNHSQSWWSAMYQLTPVQSFYAGLENSDMQI